MYIYNSRYSLNKMIPGKKKQSQISLRETYSRKNIENKLIVEMPGIEPGTFHMQSERSTAELQPHLYSCNCLNSLSSISFRFQ